MPAAICPHCARDDKASLLIELPDGDLWHCGRCAESFVEAAGSAAGIPRRDMPAGVRGQPVLDRVFLMVAAFFFALLLLVILAAILLPIQHAGPAP